MTTYGHDLLTARFAKLAPRPLAGDWDDVRERADAVRLPPGRVARSLWRGTHRRKLGVALAAVALVAAVGAAAYGTVRAFILDKGFIGLPPVGATPSSPKSGNLVMFWVGRSATLRMSKDRGPIVRAWVYDDGRIIWSRAGEPFAKPVAQAANDITSGYLEQRLTPEGVELLRAAVADLFDRTHALVETVPVSDDPGSGPPDHALIVPGGYGSTWGSVRVPRGDRLVRLIWGELGRGEYFRGRRATPEQLSALRRVDALLTNPASVLPAGAWAVRTVKAYVPSHYAVCIDHSPPKSASELLSVLPAQAADVLRNASVTQSNCFKLTTERAREVAGALSGLDSAGGYTSKVILAYQLGGGATGSARTLIRFEPYFPHGQFIRSDSG